MKTRGVEEKQAGRESRSVRVQAMISPALLKKLEDRAAKEHRTLSTMIELLLGRAVDKD